LGFKTFLLVELDVDEQEHVMGLHAHTTYFLVLFDLEDIFLVKSWTLIV
jgi:hypothetical protein